MHQIPRPHWGSIQRSPSPLAGLGVGPPGKRKEEGEWERRRGGEEGRGGEGKGG